MATLPTTYRGRLPQMRRRGSPIPLIRDSPSPTPSWFSNSDSFECPICSTTLCTVSAAVFDEHVDHCESRRTMNSRSARRRPISPSTSSDAGTLETPSDVNVSTAHTPCHEYDDARYTISGMGDAVEFGGFGAVEPLDTDGVGVDYEHYVPRSVSLRRKQLLGRAGLRRRLPIDINPSGAMGLTP